MSYSFHEDLTYEQRLFRYTINASKHEPRFLIFRGLQALNINRLQSDLAKYKNTIWKNEAISDSESLTQLLHDYSKTRSRLDAQTLD